MFPFDPSIDCPRYHSHGCDRTYDAVLYAGGIKAGLHPYRQGKGIGKDLVILKYALRNAMLPIVTIIGLRPGFYFQAQY